MHETNASLICWIGLHWCHQSWNHHSWLMILNLFSLTQNDHCSALWCRSCYSSHSDWSLLPGGWVGCSVKSDQIFKIRHSLTFSTIIPVSHVTIHSSIASKATRKRGIFQNHTAFVQEVSPWLMSPFVCKRFCPQFVNVDSGENREVIPPENVLN